MLNGFIEVDALARRSPASACCGGAWPSRRRCSPSTPTATATVAQAGTPWAPELRAGSSCRCEWALLLTDRALKALPDRGRPGPPTAGTTTSFGLARKQAIRKTARMRTQRSNRFAQSAADARRVAAASATRPVTEEILAFDAHRHGNHGPWEASISPCGDCDPRMEKAASRAALPSARFRK